MNKILITIVSVLVISSVFSQKIFKNDSSLYGLKNKSGEIVLEASFDYISEIDVAKPLDIDIYYYYSQKDPSKRYVSVEKNNKYGLYDMNGKEILPIENDYFFREMSVDSVLVFRNEDKKHSFIDLRNKKVVVTEFNYIETFYEGLARITSKTVKIGYIDKTGQLKVQPIYKYGSDFSNGFAIVSNESQKKGYIDSSGKEITPLKYDLAENFSQGLGIVNIGGKRDNHAHFYGGKYGLVNSSGKEISEIKYDLIKPFNFLDNNQIPVNIGAKWDKNCPCMRGGKWAIFDYSTSKEVTGFIYDEIWRNKELNNTYSVKINGKYGLINEKGEVVASNIYDFISYSKEINLFRIKKNNLMGMIDEKGNIVVPIEYEWINYNAVRNEINVKKDGREFIIDTKGEEIK